MGPFLAPFGLQGWELVNSSMQCAHTAYGMPRSWSIFVTMKRPVLPG